MAPNPRRVPPELVFETVLFIPPEYGFANQHLCSSSWLIRAFLLPRIIEWKKGSESAGGGGDDAAKQSGAQPPKEDQKAQIQAVLFAMANSLEQMENSLAEMGQQIGQQIDHMGQQIGQQLGHMGQQVGHMGQQIGHLGTVLDETEPKELSTAQPPQSSSHNDENRAQAEKIRRLRKAVAKQQEIPLGLVRDVVDSFPISSAFTISGKVFDFGAKLRAYGNRPLSAGNGSEPALSISPVQANDSEKVVELKAELRIYKSILNFIGGCLMFGGAIGMVGAVIIYLKK